MTTADHTTNWDSLSNTSIVAQLGIVIRQFRLQQNLTQEKLAIRAGLSRSAICELEKGKTATSLITIVQVLRALEQLQVFDSWKTAEIELPLMQVKMPGKKGLRAPSRVVYEKKRDENEWEWL